MHTDLAGIDVNALAIEPMNGQVCLRSDPSEEVTPGGIILPDQAKETRKTGVVVALPAPSLDYRPDHWRESGESFLEKLDLSVGDRVVFERYSGTEVKYRGEVFYLVPAVRLIARIRGGA